MQLIHPYHLSPMGACSGTLYGMSRWVSLKKQTNKLNNDDFKTQWLISKANVEKNVKGEFLVMVFPSFSPVLSAVYFFVGSSTHTKLDPVSIYHVSLLALSHHFIDWL